MNQIEDRTHRLKTEVSMAPTVSILQSKKQIEDLELNLDAYRNNNLVIEGTRNRQISSAVIIDWKQYQDNELVKSQLLLKDTEKDQKTVFSYLVEEWNRQEPAKVIYRWVRKSPKTNQTGAPLPFLIEEEHIYRGSMKHFRKHGDGLYIIARKYSDNSEKIKSVRGQWVQDILRTGTLLDQNGKQQLITSNVLKLTMRSKKTITPYLDKNTAIEKIRTKSMASNHNLPPANNNNSDHSVASIRDKLKKK